LIERTAALIDEYKRLFNYQTALSGVKGWSSDFAKYERQVQRARSDDHQHDAPALWIECIQLYACNKRLMLFE
jgi:hypothetical protein